MAERRENSVLFSLRELRGIEDERVKTEEETERARVEAERQAREAEIRRKKEEEEARIAAEQERIRRLEAEKEREVREGQLRLQESERRAQIEAAAKLEQARIEAEARARMDAKKFPVKAVVGGIIALVLVSGSVMGYLIYSHGEEAKRQQAALEAAQKEKARIAAEAEAEKARINKQLADLQGELDKASDEASKAKIRARMEQVSASRVSRPSKPKDDSKSTATKKVNTKSDDPLQGLGL